mgnify:CR=1 FL=1
MSPPVTGTNSGVIAWDNYSGIKVWNNIFVLDGVTQAVKADKGKNGILFQGNNYYTTRGNPTFTSSDTYYGLDAWRASGNEMLNSAPVGSDQNPELNDPGSGGNLNDTSRNY